MQYPKTLSRLLIGYKHANIAWYINQSNGLKLVRADGFQARCKQFISEHSLGDRAVALFLRIHWATTYVQPQR